ncbi:MAG: bifunctional diaminohydroxyphosphoribosylaminopyrimidine deaminase/5-amino-6-(5-phosphoribosylamino)uracil reductase RibD [Anaerovoracaceae bacterium]
MNDNEYMNMAIELAIKGEGYVNPNPKVGAVIVKNNKVIGKGYHTKFGSIHGEIEALMNCSEDPKGATLYVTLEPCCNYGKTPPCTEAIIKSGIREVVIGTLDPNKNVNGKGKAILEEAGIKVRMGSDEAKCINLNKPFNKMMTKGEPYVTLKYAMTMDGKIATKTGKSKWITSDKSRHEVHVERHRNMAIMVGIGTVLADNPYLTCRIENGKSPIRIICDTNLRLPIDSNVVNTANEVKTIVATCNNDEIIHKKYIEKGVEILKVSKKNNRVDLKNLMVLLGEKNVDSILLEGGSELNWQALNTQIVDEVHGYIAPKIFGGDAKNPVMGEGVSEVDSCFRLAPIEAKMIDDDLLIKSEVIYHCSQE